MDPKDSTFKFRLTQSERTMLEAIADHTGLSAADIIRQGIRQAFAALPPAARKASKKDKP